MNDNIYGQLAEALDRLPNCFPRTKSNVEIRLLKKLFSPEEASIAAQLTEKLITLDTIAETVGLSLEDTRVRLAKMAERGLVWLDKSAFNPDYDHDRLIQAENPGFRLAPFIVGIFESTDSEWDHEFIHLLEEYLADGGAVGIMQPQPSIHRVLPAHGAVKFEQILPYEDVRELLLNPDNNKFRIRDCQCRKAQDFHGDRKCDFTLRACISFSTLAHVPTPSKKVEISREEALDILDQCRDAGMVHTVTNVVKGINYICNCCGCCCEMLRGIKEWGIEKSVASSSYFAFLDPDECEGCETCIERCQVDAIFEQDGVAVVDRERCIGCGLCATGCPNDAAKLHRKPEAEIIRPPKDFATWEHERLHNRGLTK
jgi:NAD-dependent dihydropyrimidine dehydrogenase PreA subunit